MTAKHSPPKGSMQGKEKGQRGWSPGDDVRQDKRRPVGEDSASSRTVPKMQRR